MGRCLSQSSTKNLFDNIGTGNDTLLGQGVNDTMYGNGKATFVDTSSMVVKESTTAEVTFMNEGAGYKNALGVYEIDEEGNIKEVKILFANASKEGSGGELKPGESKVEFEVSEGAKLGFFVVSNGYGKGSENQKLLSSEDGSFVFLTKDGKPGTVGDKDLVLYHKDAETGELTPIKSQYGTDTYHSYTDKETGDNPNADNFDHVVVRANSVSGKLLVGFEDLKNGGDKDFDDTVIKIKIGQENVVAMLPEKEPPATPKPDDDVLYGGDGDMAMMKCMALEAMTSFTGAAAMTTCMVTPVTTFCMATMATMSWTEIPAMTNCMAVAARTH